jgi:chromosome segregation ATPase
MSDDKTKEQNEIILPTPNIDPNVADSKGFEDLTGQIAAHLNALREQIKPLERLPEIERRQTNIDQGIINLGKRLEANEADIIAIKESLAKLDAKFDEQLQGQLGSMNGEIAGIRVDIEKGFRLLDRQMDSLSGSITRLRADHRDLEDRVIGTERKAS